MNELNKAFRNFSLKKKRLFYFLLIVFSIMLIAAAPFLVYNDTRN